MRYWGATLQCIGPGIRDWLFPPEQQCTVLSFTLGARCYQLVCMCPRNNRAPCCFECHWLCTAVSFTAPQRKPRKMEFFAPTALAIFLCG